MIAAAVCGSSERKKIRHTGKLDESVVVSSEKVARDISCVMRSPDGLFLDITAAGTLDVLVRAERQK